MKINEKNSMEINRNLLTTMKVHEKQCKSMKIKKNQRQLMKSIKINKSNENQWAGETLGGSVNAGGKMSKNGSRNENDC